MKKLFILLVFLPIIGFSQDFNYKRFGINEEEAIPKGLEIGSKAPKFTALDAEGQQLKLSSVLAKQPVILIFYRGQWCPVCSKYLRNLNDSLSHITEKGVRLIAVGPETAENALKSMHNAGGGFTFITDTDAKIMKAYDVLFSVTEKYDKMIQNRLNTSIKDNNGSEKSELPVPATYIISQDGKIVYKQFNLNYGKRASVKEMLAHL